MVAGVIHSVRRRHGLRPMRRQMRDRITYEEFTEQFLTALPELREGYEAYLSEWVKGGPGAYNIADDILVPHIESLARSHPQGDLRRIMEFIEDLAVLGDEHLQDLVCVGILYSFGDEVRSAVMPFIGPETARLGNAGGFHYFAGVERYNRLQNILLMEDLTPAEEQFLLKEGKNLEDAMEAWEAQRLDIRGKHKTRE